MKIFTEEEALQRIAGLCSSSEYCIWDITEKLKRWHLPPGSIKKIVSRLIEEHFVDERRYAKAFVRDKYRFNKWGTAKIVQYLRMKYIDDENITQAIDEIDRKEYLSILSSLLSAKKKMIHGKDDYERYLKLLHFALGRGFEMDDIRRILNDSNNGDISEE